MKIEKNTANNAGKALLIKRYRDMFRIPENQDNYSETAYKDTERKFLNYLIIQGIVEEAEEFFKQWGHSSDRRTQRRSGARIMEVPCTHCNNVLSLNDLFETVYFDDEVNLFCSKG